MFTQEVLGAAAEGAERPIVFPMSNPTSKMVRRSQHAAPPPPTLQPAAPVAPAPADPVPSPTPGRSCG